MLKSLSELLPNCHGPKRACSIVVGCGSLLIAWYTTFLANHHLGYGPPLLWFAPGILATAYVGGFVPGIVVTALSAFTAVFWYLPPYFSLQVESSNDLARLLVFVFLGFLISYAMERLHRAHRATTDALERLAARENELKHILTVAPAAILSFDTDKKYRFCNQTFKDWLNLGNPKLVGLSIKDIIPPTCYEKLSLHCEEVFAGKKVSFDQHITINDQQRYVHVEMVPELDEEDKICGCIVLKYDITSRYKLELSLQEARAAAESANKHKSNFLATMSHEIRTPLGVIMGFTDLIDQSKMPLPERALVETIKRNAVNLLNLINGILDLAKVESGQIEKSVQSISTADFFLDLAQQFSVMASKKGTNLRLELSANLPEAFSSDETRLRQIVTNLVGNSIKFTSGGEIVISAQTIEATNLDHLNSRKLIKVTVRDTGIGISPHEHDKIFEPFVQAKEFLNRDFGGTGLGLCLAREMAKVLGGYLWLEHSKPGKGSRFSFTFPIGKDSTRKKDSKVSALITDSSLNESKTQLLGKRILLVEDIEENQYLIKAFLNHHGADVNIAADGEEGVAMALADDYELILMDIQMPKLNGYRAAEKLRHKGYKGPIIALTAHAMTGELERCLASGFNDYLSKPVDRIHLVTMAEHYINKKTEKSLTKNSPPLSTTRGASNFQY